MHLPIPDHRLWPIKQMFHEYDLDRFIAIGNHVNADPFHGLPPGTVRFSLSASEEWEGSARFWTETIAPTYRQSGWDLEVLLSNGERKKAYEYPRVTNAVLFPNGESKESNT